MVTPNTHAAAVAQMQVRNLIAGLRKCADVVSSPREADALARAVHMLEDADRSVWVWRQVLKGSD